MKGLTYNISEEDIIKSSKFFTTQMRLEYKKDGDISTIRIYRNEFGKMKSNGFQNRTKCIIQG